MAELREERRQLMRQLRGMAAVGASTGEGLDAGARLHANIATENLILNRFQVHLESSLPTTSSLHRIGD